MGHETRYTLLMTSLPYHGPLFGAKQTPLSRFRLDQRLTMLEESDAVRLRRIENLLQWGNLPIEYSDVEIVRQTRELVTELEEERLKHIVSARMEFRTVVAALRRRRRGEPASQPGLADTSETWGYGQWMPRIQQYWHEPDFRLEGVYPWLRHAVQLLENGDTFGLERLLLGVVWEQLARAGQGHYFDFVAVVVYVLRWNVIERWTTYNRTAAAERFDHLVEAGLGGFASVF